MELELAPAPVDVSTAPHDGGPNSPCSVVLGAPASNGETGILRSLSSAVGHDVRTRGPHEPAWPSTDTSTTTWDRRRAVGVLNGVRPTRDDAIRALAPHLVRLPVTVAASEVSRLVGLGVGSVQLMVGPPLLKAEAARRGMNNTELIAACRSADITPDCPLPGAVGDPTMNGWDSAVISMLNTTAWMRSAGLPVVCVLHRAVVVHPSVPLWTRCGETIARIISITSATAHCSCVNAPISLPCSACHACDSFQVLRYDTQHSLVWFVARFPPAHAQPSPLARACARVAQCTS